MGYGSENEFNQLRDAILERRVTAFDYISSAGVRSGREVDPYQLIYKGSGWYLRGWDEHRQAWRLFRLSRMRKIHLCPRFFTPRALDPEPVDDPHQGPEPVTLLLLFESRAEFRILDEYPEETLCRLEDGRFLARPCWRLDDWVFSHLMSYGDMVTVLAPGYVREALIRRIQAALNRYERPESR